MILRLQSRGGSVPGIYCGNDLRLLENNVEDDGFGAGRLTPKQLNEIRVLGGQRQNEQAPRDQKFLHEAAQYLELRRRGAC